MADLGTGCGVVALLLARRFPHLRLVGVELQTSLVRMAARNVAENGVADRVEMVQADIRHLLSLFPAGGFGTVVCNPPYRRVGHGRLNANPEKAIARHELTVTLIQVLEAARHLLRHHGVLALIYHPSRLGELCVQLDAMRLCPRRMRFIHPAPAAAASMVLVEAVQGGSDALTVMPPLTLAACAPGAC
jgi:tRNA1Val (adenine37-N6)-methyltransferase